MHLCIHNKTKFIIRLLYLLVPTLKKNAIIFYFISQRFTRARINPKTYINSLKKHKLCFEVKLVSYLNNKIGRCF